MRDLGAVYKKRIEDWHEEQAKQNKQPRLSVENLLETEVESQLKVVETQENIEKIVLLTRIAEMMGLDPTKIFK